FMKGHKGHAVGLLKDLVRVESGLERALVAALGPLADAVVYEDTSRALEDAPSGDGAILAIAAGGPVPMGLTGERKLLAAVDADPVARGIVSTVLRDVYLAGSVSEASQKQSAYPSASFVTAEGVLVGPAVIHTAREADVRLREIRAELQVLEHDLAATRNTLKPKRERLDEIGTEVTFLQEQIVAADSDITAAAERSSMIERELHGLRKEEEVLGQRLAALDLDAAAWRERLAVIEPLAQDMPELLPVPQQPVSARVAVETLRRDRARHDQRIVDMRAERDALSIHDPIRLREAVAQAETARAEAEGAVRRVEEETERTTQLRETALAIERAAAEKEAAVNKSWRDASTHLDELRQRYEDEDRLRGDIERRIGEAERLLKEGHQRDPREALETLTDEEDVRALEKRAELVQRRLALLGRVNLLATGELESMQERHDFMQRELDDVRKARRDLLEVIGQVDREITETFDLAFKDVAVQFERLIKELFPGGEGRLILTDPANPLESGIEIEASPGRKRVKRISLLSGGERSLTAMAFLFAIFTARPSPFYLMDEVEPALDDVNLHRFLRLVEGFASRSQVLIVTHQKRTMEIAGMLYGISLNKDGTTKVVCQTLEHPETTLTDAAREAAAAEVRREEEAAASAPQPTAEDEPVVEVPADVPDGAPVH
ncbi:MAG: chromosome segregation protein, partial [Actinomycetota bacterium]|nr:chromosome segregation protein [Actinomycetota bacterium]